MTPHRRLWMTLAGLLAATLLACGGLTLTAAAQTKKKAPVRRVTRPQRAPTRARIIEIQEALTQEGAYSGKPSGRWDAKTTQAMKDFQTSKGLTPTGKLGARSLQELGLGSEVAGKGAPAPLADAQPSAMSESELDNPDEESDADSEGAAEEGP